MMMMMIIIIIVVVVVVALTMQTVRHHPGAMLGWLRVADVLLQVHDG